jgi:hypothetical protein
MAENDKYKMADTVKSIIAQYRSGELDWHPEFVTYWHAGVQLCLPRPFHWEEYRSIHDKCQGHEGFWVEGVSLVKSPLNCINKHTKTKYPDSRACTWLEQIFGSMPTGSTYQCHNGSYFPLDCRIGHFCWALFLTIFFR